MPPYDPDTLYFRNKDTGKAVTVPRGRLQEFGADTLRKGETWEPATRYFAGDRSYIVPDGSRAEWFLDRMKALGQPTSTEKAAWESYQERLNAETQAEIKAGRKAIPGLVKTTLDTSMEDARKEFGWKVGDPERSEGITPARASAMWGVQPKMEKSFFERDPGTLEMGAVGLAEGGSGALRTLGILIEEGGRLAEQKLAPAARIKLDAAIEKIAPEFYERRRREALSFDPTMREADTGVIEGTGEKIRTRFENQLEEIGRVYPRKMVTEDPKALMDPAYWSRNVGQAAVSQGIMALTGGGTAAGMAVAGGAMEAIPAFRDMVEVEGIPRDDAIKRAAAFGAMVAGLEKFGLDRIFKSGGKKPIKTAIMAALSEPGQEWAEDPVGALITHLGRQGVTLSEVGRKIVEAAWQGLNVIPASFALGGGMNVGQQVITGKARQERLGALRAQRAARGMTPAEIDASQDEGDQAGPDITVAPTEEEMPENKTFQLEVPGKKAEAVPEDTGEGDEVAADLEPEAKPAEPAAPAVTPEADPATEPVVEPKPEPTVPEDQAPESVAELASLIQARRDVQADREMPEPERKAALDRIDQKILDVQRRGETPAAQPEEEELPPLPDNWEKLPVRKVLQLARERGIRAKTKTAAVIALKEQEGTRLVQPEPVVEAEPVAETPEPLPDNWEKLPVRKVVRLARDRGFDVKTKKAAVAALQGQERTGDLHAKVEAREPIGRAEAEALTVLPEGYNWNPETEQYEHAGAKPAGKPKSFLDSLDDAARDELRSLRSGSTLGMNKPIGIAANYVVIGAVKIARGVVKFSEWSKQMVSEFGENVRPHLRSIWDASREVAGTGHIERDDEPAVRAAAEQAAKRIAGLEEPPGVVGEAAEAPTSEVGEEGIPGTLDVELMDEWIGDKDEAQLEANVATGNLQKRIMATVPKGMSKRKRIAEARRIDEAIQFYIDLKGREEMAAKYRPHLLPEDRRTLDRSQNLTPEQIEIAEELIALNRKSGEEAIGKGVIGNAMDNYTMRLWDFGREESRRPFALTTARAKRRTLESILEGLASVDKDGNQKPRYRLKLRGATANYQTMRHSIANVISDRNFLMLGKKMGVFSRFKLDGWKEIDNRSFRDYVWRGKVDSMDANEIRGQNFFISEDGNVFEKVPMYAPNAVADKLNAIIGRQEVDPGISKIEKFNAVTKQMLLTTSLFHHQAYLRSYLLGGKIPLSQLVTEPIRGVAGALKYILGTPNPVRMAGRAVNPFGQLIAGVRNMKGFKEGQQAVANMSPEIRLLTRAGLTLGRVQDWDENAIQSLRTNLRQKLKRAGVFGKPAEMILDFQEEQTRILFQEVGPFLKTQAALLELRSALRESKDDIAAGKTTEYEVAKSVAKLINDDFGGLHHARLGRTRRRTRMLRVFELAEDWTHSNVRSMVKTVMQRNPETGKVELARGFEGKLYRRFWGRVLMKAAIFTTIWNFLMAMFDDDEMGDSTPERFMNRWKRAWEEGHLRWLDVDITPIYRAIYRSFGGDPNPDVRKYFSLIGHFRDPVKFVSHPFRSAKHKGSVAARMMLDLAFGSDWAGRRFTTAPELLGVDDKGEYETTREGHYEKGDPKGGKLKGRFVAKTPSRGKPVEYGQILSYLAYEGRSILPIQVQQAIAFLTGEIDAFDAITKGVGLYTSTTYPDSKKKSEG